MSKRVSVSGSVVTSSSTGFITSRVLKCLEAALVVEGGLEKNACVCVCEQARVRAQK